MKRKFYIYKNGNYYEDSKSMTTAGEIDSESATAGQVLAADGNGGAGWGTLKTINNGSLVGAGNLNLATKTELDEVKDELENASVDVLDYSMGKVSGKDDGLALPEESQLELKALRGNSVAWNQLVQNGNFANTDGWTASGGITFTVQNNVATITSDGTAYARIYEQVPIVSGHKYLTFFFAKSSNRNSIMISSAIGWHFVDIGSSWTNVAEITTATNTEEHSLVYGFGSGVASGSTFDIKNIVFTDLTKIFGAGNEPTAVADPKAQWAINYALKHPANDAGSLVSVNMFAFETIGFNQWDEEWEVGAYNGDNGTPVTNNNQIRSKNPIKVIPNETYFVTSPAKVRILFYASDGSFIRQNASLLQNESFVTPANCDIVKFHVSNTYGTTYNHDIRINISDTSLNGTYKPSEKNTYPISFNGKSAGSVYDERKADGTDIVRIGVLDLGTPNWGYNPATKCFITDALSSLVKPSATTGTKGNLLSALYQTRTSYEIQNTDVDGIAVNNSSTPTLFVKNLAYTDPTAFKTAMSGKPLYFELATPVESVSDPLPNAIKVYQNGTEWQINDGAPCGMEKNYDVSIKGQVITNVRVDARQEEEIKELKETAMTSNEKGFVTSEYEKTLNLWDEQWELGDFDFSTGAVSTNANRIRSKNFIPVQPSTAYSISSNDIRFCYYDASFTFISASSWNVTTINTPATCRYVKFAKANTTTYGNDIMFNLGSTALPYQSHNGRIMHEIDCKGVLVWQNGNPNAAFSASVVSVNDLSNYKKLLIVVNRGYNQIYMQHFMLDVGVGNYCAISFVVSARYLYTRTAQIQSSTSIRFTEGSFSDITTASPVSYDDGCVPIAIYGIK